MISFELFNPFKLETEPFSIEEAGNGQTSAACARPIVKGVFNLNEILLGCPTSELIFQTDESLKTRGAYKKRFLWRRFLFTYAWDAMFHKIVKSDASILGKLERRQTISGKIKGIKMEVDVDARTSNRLFFVTTAALITVTEMPPWYVSFLKKLEMLTHIAVWLDRMNGKKSVAEIHIVLLDSPEVAVIKPHYTPVGMKRAFDIVENLNVEYLKQKGETYNPSKTACRECNITNQCKEMMK